MLANNTSSQNARTFLVWCPTVHGCCPENLFRHGRRLSSPTQQEQTHAPAPAVTTEAVASLTVALDRYEAASAEARAAADSAVDRQIDLAKAGLSGSDTAHGDDLVHAPAAADSDGKAAGSEVLQQELATQRQSMDAMLGEQTAV